jgi:hypothetical protein
MFSAETAIVLGAPGNIVIKRWQSAEAMHTFAEPMMKRAR